MTQVTSYLDRHLSFPLFALSSLEANKFPLQEVHVAQYELARGTNMFDYAVLLFVQIHPGEQIPSGDKQIVSCWLCYSMYLFF